MSTPTLNPKQKKFADLFLSGMDAGPAYTAAGYSRNGAKESACRLLKTPAVAAYIAAEQQRLSELTHLKQWQALEFLTQAVITPISDIDECSVLAQEVTRDEIGGGTHGQLKRGNADSGNEVESPVVMRTKIKMVDKLGAIDRIAKMLGWYAPQQVQVSATSELADLISSIRSGKPA